MEPLGHSLPLVRSHRGLVEVHPDRLAIPVLNQMHRPPSPSSPGTEIESHLALVGAHSRRWQPEDRMHLEIPSGLDSRTGFGRRHPGDLDFDLLAGRVQEGSFRKVERVRRDTDPVFILIVGVNLIDELVLELEPLWRPNVARPWSEMSEPDGLSDLDRKPRRTLDAGLAVLTGIQNNRIPHGIGAPLAGNGLDRQVRPVRRRGHRLGGRWSRRDFGRRWGNGWIPSPARGEDQECQKSEPAPQRGGATHGGTRVPDPPCGCQRAPRCGPSDP